MICNCIISRLHSEYMFYSVLLKDMAHYTHQSLIDTIETLKDAGKFAEALTMVNQLLTKDPTNEDALLQVTDIQYRQGEISKAAKAIDFLNSTNNNQAPL